MSAAGYHFNIRSAARAALMDVKDVPDIAWEGGPAYQPVKGTPYISESVRPLTSDPRSMGYGGKILHTTVIALTLHYPSGQGTKSVELMAGAILDAFKPGTGLSDSGDSALVTRAERKPLNVEADWISCPVIINLVGYTPN